MFHVPSACFSALLKNPCERARFGRSEKSSFVLNTMTVPGMKREASFALTMRSSFFTGATSSVSVPFTILTLSAVIGFFPASYGEKAKKSLAFFPGKVRNSPVRTVVFPGSTRKVSVEKMTPFPSSSTSLSRTLIPGASPQSAFSGNSIGSAPQARHAAAKENAAI